MLSFFPMKHQWLITFKQIWSIMWRKRRLRGISERELCDTLHNHRHTWSTQWLPITNQPLKEVCNLCKIGIHIFALLEQQCEWLGIKTCAFQQSEKILDCQDHDPHHQDQMIVRGVWSLSTCKSCGDDTMVYYCADGKESLPYFTWFKIKNLAAKKVCAQPKRHPPPIVWMAKDKPKWRPL